MSPNIATKLSNAKMVNRVHKSDIKLKKKESVPKAPYDFFLNHTL